jgi:Uma2 family endonuclease
VSSAANPYADVTLVPRIAVRFPLVLPAPAGFDSERPETWPRVEGRLEYVRGRLEFMPPCGEVQQRVAIDIGTELNVWRRSHPEFVVGGNEAGMLLGGEVRGADVAVWRGGFPPRSGFARTAPVLAVEIVGEDEGAEALRAKARWYIEHGVPLVWVVEPEARSVEVHTAQGVTRVADRIPESALLPGLAPFVADFFRQL